MLNKVLAVLLLCASGATQTKAPKTKYDVPKPPPPVYEIKLSEDADFATMPWANDWPDPGRGNCNGDGNLYISKWPPGQGLAGFTSKGIITFASDKMSDIPTPIAAREFILQAGVYLGVEGTENPKQETEILEDQEGRKLELHRITGEKHSYIARFDKDGTYKGGIKLDLPFYAYTLAHSRREVWSHKVWMRTRFRGSHSWIRARS